MYDIILKIFFFISLSVAVVFVIFFIRSLVKDKNSFFRPLYILLLGVFFAAILIYIPISLHELENEPGNTVVTSVIVAVRKALGLFVVNEDFGEVPKALNESEGWLQTAYGVYTSVLFVLAPILSFSAVLSLLRMFWDEIKFRIGSNHKTIYIFTDFNEQSVLLANSVRNLEQKKKRSGSAGNHDNSTLKPRKRGKIVFTNMSLDNNIEDSEYYISAKKNGAVFLKERAVDLLPIIKKGKNRIEIFVIGDNEARNISKTLEISEEYKDRKNTHIFLFSPSSETGMIVDAIRGERYEPLKENDKGEVIRPNFFPKALFNELEKKSDKNARVILDGLEKSDGIGDFSVIRVDPLNLLCLECLTNKKLLLDIKNDCETQQNDKKTISILIIGMGSIGKKILKTGIWMFQMDGYKVEFNIIDKSPDIRRILEHECPELINPPTTGEDGNADYKINIHDNIDCFTSDFDKWFDRNKDIIKNTQIAFVLTGDDAQNLEVSIMLRERFSLLRDIDNNEVLTFDNSDIDNYDHTEKEPDKTDDYRSCELPFIFSVLYDEDNADTMGNHIRQKEDINDGRSSIILKNYKKEAPYNIKFIGNLDYQFSYKCVNEQNEREYNALKHHFDWVETQSYLQKNYNSNSVFRNKVRLELVQGKIDREKVDNLEKGLIDYCKNAGKDNSPERNKQQEVKKKSGTTTGLFKDNMKSIIDYYKYEYYRTSSIAKEVHRGKILPVFMNDELKEFEIKMEHIVSEAGNVDGSDNIKPCECEMCTRIRKSEHMRWVAFMRSIGYCYGKKRNDRAKRHPDLKAWSKLDFLDRFKD